MTGQASQPGIVDSAKQVLNGEERREDKDELTSTDFSNAATGVQDKLAGALNYVKDSLSPATGGQASQGGAENDPEVREFRSAAAEAVDGAKEAVKPQDSASNQQGSLYEKASDAAGAVKEKVLPTAQAAGPDEGEKVESAAQQAKDKVVGGANYVAERFTASPAGSDSKGKQQQAGGDPSSSFGAAARDAKDSIASGAGYVADRFTANPSGEDKAGDKKPADEGKGGSFLSGILPKSNEDDAKKGSEGPSLGDKAKDKYDSFKDEANKKQDSIADQITPTTQEEADISEGYIPSSTK